MPTPAPYNLLIASSREEAERLRRAFDLDPRIWDAVGLQESLGGLRYLRIVCALPNSITVETKNIVSHLGAKLWPEGELHIL